MHGTTDLKYHYQSTRLQRFRETTGTSAKIPSTPRQLLKADPPQWACSEPKWRSSKQTGPAARLLRSWVRIPPRAWIFVCCECRMLSGRGLCDELIIRPEESYRLCCVVVCDLETSRTGVPYTYDISNLRVKVAENIIITELLDNIFSARPLHNKLKILNKGRPTAPLPNVITHQNTP